MSNPGNVEKVERLMDVLACPKCKGEVKLNKEEREIVCSSCRLKFPIEDGIPNMLLEDAEQY